MARKIGVPVAKRKAVEICKGLLDWLRSDDTRIYIAAYLTEHGIGKRMMEEAIRLYPHVADYLDQAVTIVESRICQRLTDPSDTAVSKPVAELLLAWLCDWRQCNVPASMPSVTVNVSQAQLSTAEQRLQAMATIDDHQAPPTLVPSVDRAEGRIDRSLPTSLIGDSSGPFDDDRGSASAVTEYIGRAELVPDAESSGAEGGHRR